MNSQHLRTSQAGRRGHARATVALGLMLVALTASPVLAWHHHHHPRHRPYAVWRGDHVPYSRWAAQRDVPAPLYMYHSPYPCSSLDDCDRKDYDESGTRGRLGLGASPYHPEGPGNPSGP
jgi:hypothetical protein